MVSLFTFEPTLTTGTMSIDALDASGRGLFVNGATLSKQMGHNNDVTGDSVRLGTTMASVVVSAPPVLAAFGFYISLWIKLETTAVFPMKLVSSFEAFSLDMNSRRLLSLSLGGAVPNVKGPLDTNFNVVNEWMFLLVGFHKPSMTVLRAFIDSANVRFDSAPVIAADGWGDIPICTKPYVIGANSGVNMGRLSDGPIGLVDDVARFDIQTAKQEMTPDLANAIADGSLFRAVLTGQPTDAFTPRTGTTLATTRLTIATKPTEATSDAASESSSSPFSSSTVYIVVGVVIGVLVLLGVLIAVLFLARRKSRERRETMASAMYPSQQWGSSAQPYVPPMMSARSPTVSGQMYAPALDERTGTVLANSLPSIELTGRPNDYRDIALPSQMGYADVVGNSSASSFVPPFSRPITAPNLAYNDLPASYKGAYSNIEM